MNNMIITSSPRQQYSLINLTFLDILHGECGSILIDILSECNQFLARLVVHHKKAVEVVLVTIQSSDAIISLKELLNLCRQLVNNISIVFEISEITDLDKVVNCVKWSWELFSVLNHAHQK